MLITKKFVFVHQPKTGGTFVREALEEISRFELQDPLTGLLKRHALLSRKYRCRQVEPFHGTCHDIPESERSKSLVSIVRNPFDFYVSFYHFGWWASHPEDSYSDMGPVIEMYPHFPKLSFDEFLILANRFFNEFRMIGADLDPFNRRLGYYSTQFILYFFREPEKAYQRIANGFGWNAKEDMYEVTFLRTSNLNRDLVQYLQWQDYPARWLKSILRKQPVRPAEQLSQRPVGDYRPYYSDFARDFVRRKERLIFSLFPEFDF